VPKLINPKDNITKYDKAHREHGTPIRALLPQRSMRVIGQAYDRGIIAAPKEGK
jgi:hypothetical protein